MNRAHLTEAVWIVGGQAATALGTLVGVRLLTQLLPPATYGSVSLLLGLSTLALTLGAAPLTQAAMHFYPSLARAAALADLRQALRDCLRIAAMGVGILLVLAAITGQAMGNLQFPLLVLLALLLLSDGWRSVHLSVLNAARRQSRYSVWSAADAWARPMLAAAFVLVFGASATSVLSAQLLVSALLLLALSRSTWPVGGPAKGAGRAELESRLWQYALPLIPLGLIGWINNLSDRYLIGATLGLEEAGIYAAVYGLSSMPIMAVGGTVEQALRPIYQNAVAAGEHARAQSIFRWWLLAVAGSCGCGVAIFAFWHEQIAELLLGSRFRGAASIMPWIAAGYGIRSLAYVYERVCYAYGQTRHVLVIQCSAAIVTLVATPIGAIGWGLKGAAMAAPIYFGAQLLVAALLARQSRLQRHPLFAWVTG